MSGVNVALVEFFAALVPAWLACRTAELRVVARNGKPRSLLVVMHISGLLLLWIVWRLYVIEMNPPEGKK